MLGDLEQIVLLAVLRTAADAYGVSIADEIRRTAGRDLTLATIYKTLSRLEAKGLVRAKVGEPTPVRGGKAKRYYTLTPAGRSALRASLTTLRKMTSGLALDLGWEK